MEAMKHAAEQAKSGRGQIVAAMAEPGVGKSRLLYEFKATSQSGWMVLETFSISHGKASAYLPVIDLLRNYFNITAEDDERKRREKVTGRILALDRNLEDTLPYLFALLGIVEGDDPVAQMDGQIKKRRTLEAIKRISAARESQSAADGDLRGLALDRRADSGVAKPARRFDRDGEDTSVGRTTVPNTRINGIARPTTPSFGSIRWAWKAREEMLDRAVGRRRRVIPLKRLIIERTEGTPFFMEEIVQSLFEDGVLQRNGAVKLAKSMNVVKVPTTVQGVIAARIDRLPAEQKELLQTLAVLGREFPFELVRRVTLKPDDDLDRMLSELQLAEFIYEQPASGDVEYIFKHALDAGGGLQLAAGRAPQAHARARRTSAGVGVCWAAGGSSGRAGASLQPQRQRRQGGASICRWPAKQSLERAAYVESHAQFQHGLNLVTSIRRRH